MERAPVKASSLHNSVQVLRLERRRNAGRAGALRFRNPTKQVPMQYRLVRARMVVVTLLLMPIVLASRQETAAATTQPARATVVRFVVACGDDALRLCTGVQPGGGRVVRCLISHRSKVSPKCTSFFRRQLAARRA